MIRKKKKTLKLRRQHSGRTQSPAELAEENARRAAKDDRDEAVSARWPVGHSERWVEFARDALHGIAHAMRWTTGKKQLAPGGIPWAAVELLARAELEIARLEAALAHMKKRERIAVRAGRSVVDYLAAARKLRLEVERGPRKGRGPNDRSPF